ncbi:hydroxyacylglutathione hydrolase [Pseudomarimonas arenosa]|uniref:hydroxyacylglutathione hydrolase n=1 Tax=Pseudomarimonas arenosa TaxID=2774145 RepID=UPI002FC355B7
MNPVQPQIDALPAFSDNYVWRFTSADGTWLVDPGEPRLVASALHDSPALAGILITHHHADHVGGLAALPIDSSVRVIAPHDPRIGRASERVAEGDEVDCGGLRFNVWEVPGHTSSHIAFLATDIVFCGDTLFSLGCGRLFEGSPAQMHASLTRLASLPRTTRFYPAHEYTEANGRFALEVDPGNQDLQRYLQSVRSKRQREEASLPTSLAVELDCNPFLRCHSDSVKQSVEARQGHELISELEVFAALRQWKDVF